MHGKDAIVEDILEWRPHDCITRRMQIFDTGVNLTATHLLSDGANGGTHVEVRIAKTPADDMELFMQIAPYSTALRAERLTWPSSFTAAGFDG
jgi:hypothetical protein